MKTKFYKTVCSLCLIIFNQHNNVHKPDNKNIIKHVKNIDLDGNVIDKKHYFSCEVCKNVININKCYYFITLNSDISI